MTYSRHGFGLARNGEPSLDASATSMHVADHGIVVDRFTEDMWDRRAGLGHINVDVVFFGQRISQLLTDEIALWPTRGGGTHNDAIANRIDRPISAVINTLVNPFRH